MATERRHALRRLAAFGLGGGLWCVGDAWAAAGTGAGSAPARAPVTGAPAPLPAQHPAALPPALRRAAAGQTVLSAAWQRRDGQHQIGWLALPADGGALRVLAALDVPTRAHQVIAGTDGALLAVARRPGDWLLRWAGPGHRAQWRWADDDRRYNGHLLPSPDGRWLLSTETDLLDGLGRIVRRDAASLATVEVWPSGGRDPHQLIWAGAEAPGALYVANGGITTLPETGRRKLALGTMDSSIVRLDGHDGRLLAQWRLDDPRLSLRHLARPADERPSLPERPGASAPAPVSTATTPSATSANTSVPDSASTTAPMSTTPARLDAAGQPTASTASTAALAAGTTGPTSPPRPWLAIALQAEHDAAEARARAPVLALLDADGLRAIDAPLPLAGYGGDLCATGAGWAVSCPRVDGVALYAQDGRWVGLRSLEQAYALAAAGDGARWWVGGLQQAQRRRTDATDPQSGSAVDGLQIDNHWQWQAG
ncbi:MAG: hypothetical protein RL223_4515 [Pseudomonadota bacterium]|jgi:hypothetical protein